MLRVLIGFIVGAAVGAAAALLMAPSSGEELRNQVQDYASADMERMRSEYQKGMDELHARMDKMNKDQDADSVVVEEVEMTEIVETEVDEA